MRAEPMQADLVTAQLEAVMSDFGAHAAKTGMLANAAIVEAVAAAAQGLELPYLVVDPVIVSSSGEPLLEREGGLTLKKELLRKAHAVTPNIPEAEVLSGVSIRSEQDLREAARRLFALGAVHVVITGGHSPRAWDHGSAENSARIMDLVYDGDVFSEYAAERIGGRHTHGTRRALAAPVNAHPSLGRPPHEAGPLAPADVARAGRHAPRRGVGSGPS